jgi:hypothetical protein
VFLLLALQMTNNVRSFQQYYAMPLILCSFFFQQPLYFSCDWLYFHVLNFTIYCHQFALNNWYLSKIFKTSGKPLNLLTYLLFVMPFIIFSDPCFHATSFFFHLKIFFNLFWSVSLLVVNSLRFCLSEKVAILLFHIEHIISGYKIADW